jgi:hypothetical protein
MDKSWPGNVSCAESRLSNKEVETPTLTSRAPTVYTLFPPATSWLLFSVSFPCSSMKPMPASMHQIPWPPPRCISQISLMRPLCDRYTISFSWRSWGATIRLHTLNVSYVMLTHSHHWKPYLHIIMRIDAWMEIIEYWLKQWPAMPSEKLQSPAASTVARHIGSLPTWQPLAYHQLSFFKSKRQAVVLWATVHWQKPSSVESSVHARHCAKCLLSFYPIAGPWGGGYYCYYFTMKAIHSTRS